MEVDLQPGKYIVAVSGGVDSMVLLDILQGHPGIELVVAHFDHGIRADSAEDRKLVGDVVKTYDKTYVLTYVFAEGKLGKNTSEAKARAARYDFLKQVRKDHGAKAIVTAHHQDDVLETVIINLIRGTGRRGLSSLASTPDIVRPLLHETKAEILQYAVTHKLRWREDSTNAEDAYLRNYIRHNITARMTPVQRESLVHIVSEAGSINDEVEYLLRAHIGANPTQLKRQQIAQLPYMLACEYMAAWLRLHNIRNFDRQTIDRLVIAAKVSRPNSVISINQGHSLQVGKINLALAVSER